MTHYEQSRDGHGRPVVKVDGVVQEIRASGGFPMEDYIRVKRSVLVDVVIYHTKTNIKGCRCGWSKLGESWAEHVADIVQQRSTEEARDGD